MEIALVLEQVKNVEVIDWLIVALGDPTFDRRRVAARALGWNRCAPPGLRRR